MAILNIFKNDDIFKNKFKLDGIELLEIGEFSKQESKEISETLEIGEILEHINKLNLHNVKDYYNRKVSKVIVKACSYEGNTDISSMLVNKKDAIRKAITILERLNEGLEVIFASSSNIEGVNCKAPSKHSLELNEKAFIKEYFPQSSSKEVLILDFVDLVYLGEGFLSGEKRDYVYVAAFGSAIGKHRLLKVKIGITLKEVFEILDGKEEELIKIISGGVVSGTPKKSLEEPIEGNEKGLLFLSKKDEGSRKVNPCIRCGKCLKICPEKLNPMKLSELWNTDNKEEFLKFGGHKCIDCGLCSYICPSNIELSHKIKTAKNSFCEENSEGVRSEKNVQRII